MIAELLPATLRDDFPLLSRKVAQGKPISYLDSAATSLKPRQVIDAVAEAMGMHSANVHRSVHIIGDEATELYEGARRKVARMINAEEHELAFVRNATEGINLVAACWPRKGRVVTTLAEHHSNLLPWDEGRVTRIGVGADGAADMAEFERELQRGDVAIVAVSHVSNVAGVRTDVRRLAELAHDAGAILVVDGAQSAPHVPIDVYELDCDFFAFSSHKMCGPSGIGALFGKAEALAEMSWFLKGGATVEGVSLAGPELKQPPWRFEAGTPPIEAAAGFGAAVDYLEEIGLENVERHEQALLAQAIERVQRIEGVRIFGPTDESRCGPLSMTVPSVPPHAVARAMSDSYGICVRSGYHCAQPLHETLGLPATLRASFYLYNQPDEIERFAEALERILVLGRQQI